MYRTNWPDGGEHWIENKGRAIYAADGTLVRVMGTAMEITERKQAEAALGASEERNRLALQAAGMGTWDWDVVRDVQTWSRETEALSGLAPGTFEGTFAAFQRSIHPEDSPAVELEIARDDRRAARFARNLPSVWPDGSVHWIEGRGRALYAADGTLLRVTGTAMDITKRK